MDDLVSFTCRMPRETVERLDENAQALGMSRQAFISMICDASTGGGSLKMIKQAYKAAKMAQDAKEIENGVMANA